MRAHLFVRLVCAGVLTVFLMLFGVLTQDVKYEWLANLLFAPGLWVTGIVAPPGVHGSQHPKVEFAVDMAFAWIVVLLILTLIDLAIFRKRKIV
jgi:hypothetical protein